MLLKSIAALVIISILLLIAFCSPPPAKAQTWSAQDVTGPKCRMASKHCWCDEMASAEDIEREPDRYERVPDYYGDKNSPSVCIEYVDKEQSAIGGRACAARRVCGGSSRFDDLFRQHRAVAGYWQ